MMLEPILPEILSVQIIPAAIPELLEAYGADPDRHVSLGLLTCSQDDPTYVALDEATKHAAVDVVFARSFYAGSAHASGRLSGEILGVLAAPDPTEVEAGLRAAVRCLEHDACFYSADDHGTIAVFPHVVSAVGSYFVDQAGPDAGLGFGDAMAYLVAPPMEATVAIDAAMKAADVRMIKLFPPPTETNYAAAWLTGELASCTAAAEAFAEAVVAIGRAPRLGRF